MRTLYSTLIIALMFAFIGTTWAAEMADGKKIDLKGTLNITKKKVRNRTVTEVTLTDAKGRVALIRLAIKDKEKRPSLKGLNQKQVEIIGTGTMKVKGKKALVTLSEVEKFAAVEAAADGGLED